MSSLELCFVPLTVDTIGDIEAESAASSTPYYDLPTNGLASVKRLQVIETVRAGGFGDELAAYTNDDERLLVGGGSYLCLLGKLSIGCWVASGFRGQGFGHQIAGSIEELAIAAFPRQRLIEVQIHPDNTGSQKIFTARGYVPTHRNDKDGNGIYQKRLIPAIA
jgi:GNAT superfamily N-acetyltransferase